MFCVVRSSCRKTGYMHSFITYSLEFSDLGFYDFRFFGFGVLGLTQKLTTAAGKRKDRLDRIGIAD